MGGFGSMMASQASQDTFTGLSTGWNIGSSYNRARYNASAMRNEAATIEAQARLTNQFQTELIVSRYRRQYKDLQYKQEMQQSANRVYALKNGITGASAANVLGSYAAKGKKNLQTLYYNAAMQIGMNTQQNFMQANSRASALRERARQYDWQANMTLVGGAINFATGYFKNNMPTSQFDPTGYDDGVMENNAIQDAGMSSNGQESALWTWMNAGPSLTTGA